MKAKLNVCQILDKYLDARLNGRLTNALSFLKSIMPGSSPF